jgi:hypothetical protein
MSTRRWLLVPPLVVAGACCGGATRTPSAHRAKSAEPTVAATTPPPVTTAAPVTDPPVVATAAPPPTIPPTTSRPVPLEDCYSVLSDIEAAWWPRIHRYVAPQELSELVHGIGRDDCQALATEDATLKKIEAQYAVACRENNPSSWRYDCPA